MQGDVRRMQRWARVGQAVDTLLTVSASQMAVFGTGNKSADVRESPTRCAEDLTQSFEHALAQKTYFGASEAVVNG